MITYSCTAVMARPGLCCSSRPSATVALHAPGTAVAVNAATDLPPASLAFESRQIELRLTASRNAHPDGLVRPLHEMRVCVRPTNYVCGQDQCDQDAHEEGVA